MNKLNFYEYKKTHGSNLLPHELIDCYRAYITNPNFKRGTP